MIRHVEESKEEAVDRQQSILFHIPPESRDKVEKILNKIQPFLTLNEDNNVLYWNNMEDVKDIPGSDIGTLLKWFFVEAPGAEEPVDAPRFFQQVLKPAGIDQDLYALHFNEGDSDSDSDRIALWKNVF